jgi:pilus assembly protein CpaF
MEGDVITMNDVFQYQVTGETPEGKLVGKYKVSRVPAACQQRLAYFGLEQEWKNALAEGDA